MSTSGQDEDFPEVSSFEPSVELPLSPSQLKCPLCNSIILRAKLGRQWSRPVGMPALPRSRQPLEAIQQKQFETDTIDEWVVVDDVWTFDNVAVSKPLTDGSRYLSCGACEEGVIGIQCSLTQEQRRGLPDAWHSLPNLNLIALGRVQQS